MLITQIFSSPLTFTAWVLALIIAITIHEFAHAFTADKLGDPTPRLLNRLTLNPLSHLDPLGTLMLFIVGFGWGKPVPFDPYQLANPRRDSALIALAGPASNLILAAFCALLIRLIPLFITNSLIVLLTYAIFLPLISLNIILAIFNLLPVHPLDGGKILVGLLPEDSAQTADQLLHQYGMIILLILILPLSGQSIVSQLIGPLVHFLTTIFIGF